MESKKLYKSRNNKKICGVCGGFAEYFGCDPTIIRLIWAVLSLFVGAGILAYFIAALVMDFPPEDTYTTM